MSFYIVRLHAKEKVRSRDKVSSLEPRTFSQQHTFMHYYIDKAANTHLLT